jgi:hypothetical protein
MRWKLLRSLMLSLPMLLLLCGPRPTSGCVPQHSQQQHLQPESSDDDNNEAGGSRQISEDYHLQPDSDPTIYNLTTIGPDDETIDALAQAAEAAAQSLENFLAGGGGSLNDPTTEDNKYADTGGDGDESAAAGAAADAAADNDINSDENEDVDDDDDVAIPAKVEADTVAEGETAAETYPAEEYYDTYDIYNYTETEYYYYSDDGESSVNDDGGAEIVEGNETLSVDTGVYRPHKNRTVIF